MGLILNLLQDLKTNQLCRTRFKEKILLFNFCQRSWRLCPNPNANYDFVLYNVHCTYYLLKLNDLFFSRTWLTKGRSVFLLLYYRDWAKAAKSASKSARSRIWTDLSAVSRPFCSAWTLHAVLFEWEGGRDAPSPCQTGCWDARWQIWLPRSSLPPRIDQGGLWTAPEENQKMQSKLWLLFCWAAVMSLAIAALEPVVFMTCLK